MNTKSVTRKKKRPAVRTRRVLFALLAAAAVVCLFFGAEAIERAVKRAEYVPLTAEEIEEAYERNTGLVIAETFRARGIDPLAVPAVLVKSHGPFTWGKTPEKAVENALVLDECAHMALLTRLFDSSAAPAAQCIQDKHYFRKHGANAYYGQK